MERTKVKNSVTLKAAAGFAVGAAIMGAAAWWFQSGKGTKPPKETSITPIPAKVDEDAITPATSIFEAATAKQQASVVESEQPSATGDTGSSPDDEIEVIHRTGSLASGVHTKGSEEVLADAIADSPTMSWRQTASEVILEVPMEDDVRGRDLVCSFTVRNLYLAVLGKVQVDEQLFAPISPDDSSWEIGCTDEGRVLTITLEKANHPESQCNWKALFAAKGSSGFQSKAEE